MIAVITLTKGAYDQGLKLKEKISCDIFHQPKPFKDKVKELFLTYDQLIFIMATGIVVRTIGPLLEHKSKDPAVLVMDEKGHHVISLLSGHLGGANQLTLEIAELMKSDPVITTSSDLNDVLSIDMFAEKYDLLLKDYEGAKVVTSFLVNGDDVNVIGGHFTEKQYVHSNGIANVFIGHLSFDSVLPAVQLYPKNLVLGIGCKRNTSYQELMAFIQETMAAYHLDIKCVKKLCSAWVKADEKCLIAMSSSLEIPFETYSQEEILKVAMDFEGSHFVMDTLGVPCVSEPTGYLGSDYGTCLVKKIKKSGMTLSIWEKKLCYM